MGWIDALPRSALLLLLLIGWQDTRAQLPAPPPAAGTGFLNGIRELLKDTKATIGGTFDAGLDTLFSAWLIDPAAQWALPLPAGPTYRPQHPLPGPLLEEGRQIVDEMLANDYRDVFFQTSLRVSRDYAHRAEGYLATCKWSLYEDAARLLARQRVAAFRRQEHLEELARALRADAATLRQAFERAAGRDSSGETLVATTGGELFFASAQKAMVLLADLIDKRPPELRTAGRSDWVQRLNVNRMPDSRLGRLTRLGGRGLGVVNTVVNLYDLAKVSLEALQMMALIPHLVEWEALATYVEGLGEQYDRLTDAQQVLLDQLETLERRQRATCAQCPKPAAR